MDTETPALTQASARKPGRWRRFAAKPLTWMLVLALALAAQWLTTRTQLRSLQEELGKRAGESQALLKQNQESLQALAGRLGPLEARLNEAQSQQLALEGMVEEMAKGRDERLLVEIEQAVAIAAQQLQLAGNVEAALIALQSADARLARAGQAQFLPLRKLINRDIDRLRALPLADVPGIALKLEGVVTGIDALPLAVEQRARPAAETTAAARGDSRWQNLGRELWSELWSELRGLVRIERMDGGEPVLLSPNQAFFLRENLKLRLIDARLALLQRDGRGFREDLRQAREWLERYFDRRAKPVQSAIATLSGLAAADLNLQAPSLAETLLALRSFKLRQPAAAPAARAAGAASRP